MATRGTEWQKPEKSKAFVFHPVIKGARTPVDRSAAGQLEEAIGLTAAIDLDVIASDIISVSKIRPNNFIGEFAADAIAEKVADNEIEIVIANCTLSPVQQRNLEKEINCKVIDRTGLILEIFGARARTREGQLQVELAHLSYQKSRLVRSWTHLERQRGGGGFMGGPGETQIELDRRIITDRIALLKRELEEVKRTRHLHRSARKRVPFPIVAFVGYTNAGKSTLFNHITNANVYAKDQLFATLDPTMRAVRLPSGRHIILSDTVGFISDLPHELVAAFHATLEEVLEADLILHVRDISSPDTNAQKQDVEHVLQHDLGLADQVETGLVEVWNKMDLLEAGLLPATSNPHYLVSAMTGAGVDHLLDEIDRRLTLNHKTLTFQIASADGASQAWCHRHGDVIHQDLTENGDVVLTVRLSPADAAKTEHMQALHLVETAATQ
jgi:GTP-binding protein HflX